MPLRVRSTQDIQEVLKRADPARLEEFMLHADDWDHDRRAILRTMVEAGAPTWQAAKMVHIERGGVRSLGDLRYIAYQVEEELREWFGKTVGEYVADLVATGLAEDVPGTLSQAIIDGAAEEGLDAVLKLSIVVVGKEKADA